jgi:hypothetical protein
MLSIRELELLRILVGNLTVLKKLKEAKRDSRGSFLGVSLRWLMLKSPHMIKSVDTLYILFNIDSNGFKK